MDDVYELGLSKSSRRHYGDTEGRASVKKVEVCSPYGCFVPYVKLCRDI